MMPVPLGTAAMREQLPACRRLAARTALTFASRHAARAMIEGDAEMSITIEHFGHVTQLTLARREAANAIGVEMALALAKAIDAFGADPNAFVLVVTGAGER
jgi:hypothetical protein